MRRIPLPHRRPLALFSLVAAAAAMSACSGAPSGDIGSIPDASLPTVSGDDDADSGAGHHDGGNGADAGKDATNADSGAADTSVPDADTGPTRVIPPDVLARKAMVYSGYRAGQSPETATYPSDAQVDADLKLLIQGGWTFLRLYDCSPFAESVMRLIKTNGYDIKVMSGIWISGDKAGFDSQNQAQITACLALYAQYGDIVAAVSVGNETLDDWSGVKVPPAELVAYIQQVRGQITQPVTTDDSYLPFTLGMDGNTSYADVIQVAQAVDFLSLHVYAFSDAPFDSWDWEQLAVPPGPKRAQAMMAAGMQYTKDSLDAVRSALGAKGVSRPIVIGEAGWKTSPTDPQDDATEKYRAHQVNEGMFYAPFADWVYGATKDASSPVAAFWFEAFDEPWKTSDDGWGLFDVDRKARYAMWTTFPSLKPPGAPPYTVNDAVYYNGPADGGAKGP
jgi:exo-beta-1,3-glucanase (GH17 family)